MDRQKVVHFARGRRPPDSGGPRTSPISLRRPRATTSVDRARVAPLVSMDRARVAPLASMEPDSFGAPPRDYIKGGNVPSQTISDSWGAGTNRRHDAHINSPTSSDIVNTNSGINGRPVDGNTVQLSRQYSQPVSSSPVIEFTRPRLVPSGGRKGSGGLDNSADSPQHEDYDFHRQPAPEPTRHYSFTSVPESRKQCESRGNLRWIRSLSRAKPNKVTSPESHHPQSNPGGTSPSSGAAWSSEKVNSTPNNASSPDTRTCSRTNDFVDGPMRQLSKDLSRDVVQNSSYETHTSQSKTNSNFTKETIIKRETQMVTKTVIRQSSFSNNSFDDANRFNNSFTEGSSSQRPQFRYAKLAYQSHSLDRAQNPHSSRSAPSTSGLHEMKEPLISPEDLLKGDNFTKFNDTPSTPPSFPHEVGARRRNYIPAAKPIPRKLSREEGLTLARDIAKSCVSNADKPPVGWKPSSPNRGRPFVQDSKSQSYKTSPLSQPKHWTSNISSSDTSFDSCSSGNYKNCAILPNRTSNVPTKHYPGSPSDTNPSSQSLGGSTSQSLGVSTTPQSPGVQPSGSPDWKRNSMRLATMGYTSMSDLTKSLDCLNLVTEADETKNVPADSQKHSNTSQPPFPKQVYRDSGTAMSKYEYGSQHVSDSPKLDSRTPDRGIGHTSPNVRRPSSGTRNPTAHQYSHRRSFEKNEPKSHDIHRGSSFNHNDFRLERETNSIIYTPTVNASLRKASPYDPNSQPVNTTSTKPPLIPKSNRESPNDSYSPTSYRAYTDTRTFAQSQPGPPPESPSNSSNTRTIRNSKENLSNVNDERTNTIKRRSLKLATSSFSDLTLDSVDISSPNLSQTLGRHSDPRPRAQDRSFHDDSSLIAGSPHSEIFYTPNVQRRGSRGPGLTGSSPNSSYNGSFYSCQSQSLSANSSPMVGRFSQYSNLDNSRESHFTNKSSGYSDTSGRSIDKTRSSSVASNTKQNTKMTEPLKIGRPLPRQNRSHVFQKESSVSPPQTLSLRGSPMQSNKSKERSTRECQDLSSLLCHTSKSTAKNSTQPNTPVNKSPTHTMNTTPTTRTPVRSRPNVLPKQTYSDSPPRARGKAGVEDSTSPTTPSHNLEVISSAASVEPRHSVYDNMDSDVDQHDDSFSDDTYEDLDSDEDSDHWVAGMPRSPPSLGRPRRKVYAGFDSQPLPMDAFFSDSSSMYTINTSCSSRTPSRSAEASRRGSDWSIETGKNLRPSSSLTYDSTRTTPTKSMFESDISISSNRSSLVAKTENDFRSEEILSDSGRREREEANENDPLYESSDAFINKGGSKSYPNLKQIKTKNMMLPLKFNTLDPDLTPTATPVDEKQNRELGQLYNVPREHTSPVKDSPGSTTPVNGAAGKKTPVLSASKSATSRPRAKSSSLGRTPKALSSRDIFDLFLTPSDRKLCASAATLTSIEKRAHKVCRAILCCNEKDRPCLVHKEYLL